MSIKRNRIQTQFEYNTVKADMSLLLIVGSCPSPDDLQLPESSLSSLRCLLYL